MQVFASFDEFFRTATDNDPYPYQRRVATEGDRLPDVIDIPPGLGKTAAVVLGWLWRRQLSGGPDTPRRLAFALPMRTLTRQTMGVIPEWLAKLGLSDEVALSQLVGGMASGGHGWRREPAKPLIIVGTVDMVLSRMLMRGYGSARNAYPVDAGLLWNDTHLVVDETQLAPASTVTARQLAAFQRQFGAMNSGLTCMSATVDADLLRTVDNPTIYDGEIVRLTEADHTPAVRRRLDASRTVRELSITQADPKAIAAAVIEHHRHGLTLVVLNTVGVAVDVFKRLIAKNSSLGDTPTILLHSRFRPADRDRSYDSLSEHSDVVVVATQVVEAGVDLNARTLITEAAPWASLIQRSGRCNRTGLIGDAELWWFASGKKSPYEPDDVEASAEALRQLENQAVSNNRLLAMTEHVHRTPPAIQTLRRSDFLPLFDTTPDLSGNDPDISPYIRDTDETDVQLAWLDFGGAEAPGADVLIPGHDARCRAGFGDVRAILRKHKVWYFDLAQPRWADARWSELRPSDPIFAGQVFVLDAAKGGYTTQLGLDPASSAPVPPIETAPIDELPGAHDPRSDTDTSEHGSLEFDGWIDLDQHLEDTRDEARALVGALPLEDQLRADIVVAARLHDLGKAHPVWQAAIVRSSPQQPTRDGVWAKSPGRGRLRYDGAVAFRHELASVALVDTAYADQLDGAFDPDLVRYLIAAHHGKVRTQIRDLTGDVTCVLGLRSGAVELPAVIGVEPRTAVIDIDPFQAVSDSTEVWADMVDRLVASYGVFRLAYYEALVRVADWNASARRDGQGIR